jgi:hypothetical protein
VLFVVFALVASIPIITHPLPPLTDYINHLARMQVIASIGHDSGESFKLFQLGSHGCALSCGSVDITRALAATQGRKCVTTAWAATSAKQMFERPGAIR